MKRVGGGDGEEIQLLPETLPEDNTREMQLLSEFPPSPDLLPGLLLTEHCRKSTGKEAREKCAAPTALLRKARVRQ